MALSYTVKDTIESCLWKYVYKWAAQKSLLGGGGRVQEKGCSKCDIQGQGSANILVQTHSGGEGVLFWMEFGEEQCIYNFPFFIYNVLKCTNMYQKQF